MARQDEENFHTEVAKIAKRGHSNSTVSGAFGLDGRSTRLARQLEEDFHTEIAKIAKRATPILQLPGRLAIRTIDALVTYS